MKQFYKTQWNIKCSINTKKEKMMTIHDSSQKEVWELVKILLAYTKTNLKYNRETVIL